MLTLTLIAIVLAIPLSSASLNMGGATISATLYTRIVAIALLFAAGLTYNMFPSIMNTSETVIDTMNILDTGLALYSGLIHASTVTQTIEVFLLISGALILIPWSTGYSVSGQNAKIATHSNFATISEYPMIILFTTLGGTFLLASADLVSMYLSIELQSFGVYILAAIYRDSESATAAGLKYFLLGALSSALILLGSALVYGYTGLTNLDSIYEFLSVPMNNDTYSQVIMLGFILISVGLLFKVASAPFHYWAPDVYDGTPTMVTTWLTVMPKISIFIFLLELYRGTNSNASSAFSGLGGETLTSTTAHLTLLPLTPPALLLLVCAFLSLVIGTVVGLGQYRIKRLLAYSTISHVGFLLLALSVGNASIIAGEESAEAFLFYIIQYTLTNIDAFFVLLAFGYCINHISSPSIGKDIQFTSELLGGFRAYPVLGLSFAICLFSMAGVPPLVGFFAKYTVLYSAIHNGYIFLAIVAILASVVSAVYYLRIIRVIHFSSISPSYKPSHSIYDPNSTLSSDSTLSETTGKENSKIVSFLPLESTHSISTLTSVHSYVIACTTLFILLFAVNPTLLLNSTSIMALSMYVT